MLLVARDPEPPQDWLPPPMMMSLAPMPEFTLLVKECESPSRRQAFWQVRN